MPPELFRPSRVLRARSVVAAVYDRRVRQIGGHRPPLHLFGVLLGFLTLATSAFAADPGADVARSVEQLRSESSYMWTVSNPPIDVSVSRSTNSRGGTSVSTMVTIAPEISGKVGPAGVARIEVHFPSALTVILLANAKGVAVAETPDGWMTSDEVKRETYAANTDPIFYQDHEYTRGGFFAGLTEAFRSRRPGDELPVILKNIVSYTSQGDEIVGELSKEAAAVALGSRSARTGKLDAEDAPLVSGSVTFRFTHGRLREYEIRAEGGADPTRYAMVHQLSMDRITTINYGASTVFDIPEDAGKKLGVK